MLDLPVEPTLRPFRKFAFPDFLWLLTMLQLRPLAEGGGVTTQALVAGQAAFHRAYERGALGEKGLSRRRVDLPAPSVTCGRSPTCRTP